MNSQSAKSAKSAVFSSSCLRAFVVQSNPDAKITRAISIAVSAGFFQHLSQITILPAGRFQIKHSILDAQAQIIQAFLQAAHGLAEAFVALAGFVGKLLQLLPLRRRERADLTHQFSQLRLEFTFVHWTVSIIN
jgi:hypothetical protein